MPPLYKILTPVQASCFPLMPEGYAGKTGETWRTVDRLSGRVVTRTRTPGGLNDQPVLPIPSGSLLVRVGSRWEGTPPDEPEVLIVGQDPADVALELWRRCAGLAG